MSHLKVGKKAVDRPEAKYWMDTVPQIAALAAKFSKAWVPLLITREDSISKGNIWRPDPGEERKEFDTSTKILVLLAISVFGQKTDAVIPSDPAEMRELFTELAVTIATSEIVMTEWFEERGDIVEEADDFGLLQRPKEGEDV